MTYSSDKEIGSDLRSQHYSFSLGRRAIESILRDLLGEDQSLLPPLQHLLTRPSFFAIDPLSTSLPQRLLARDKLISELRETYNPKMVERLQSFLDGYLDLPSIDSASRISPNNGLEIAAQSLIQATSEMTSSNAAAKPSQSSPALDISSGKDSVKDLAGGLSHISHDLSINKGAGRRRRNLILFLGLILIGGIGIAFRLSASCFLGILCLPLPTQSSQASSFSVITRAQRAAELIVNAKELSIFRIALADLDRELLRLSGDPLTAQQLKQQEALQKLAKHSHQRLSKELQEAEAVRQAKGRIDGLPSLSAEQQSTEKAIISQSLKAIPDRSFVHKEAQEQLKRLAIYAIRPTSRPPTSATRPQVDWTPQPALQPAPSPRWRSSGPSTLSNSGSRQDSWTSPRREASPPPVPQQSDDDSSNAPYRDEPLF